ncbi:UvrD-helicase domain-containing protein [Niveibacterium sp. 24ML]|uniref:UvrD-helicase domain-containing protein n=1 Tax=Niveibacterium sp. 24ML TaxID=2985512 RepID=UPI0022703F5C|nr:UvrD-helicase domain-containing protein [Niveibacterium sp. 24ML]MCX9157818.1 UvrD-helicase domain-containing protein [Niveibacterium sp. 24ML]
MSAQIEFISAGAGSGKTYTLTEMLFKRLTDDGIRPQAVIATTFTRKAAAELRERVRASLIGKGQFALANQMSLARIGTVNSVCGQLVQRFAFELGLPPELEVIEESDAQTLLRETIDATLDADIANEMASLAARLGVEDWHSELRALLDKVRTNNIAPAALPTMAGESIETLLAHFPKPRTKDLETRLGQQIEGALQAIVAAQKQKYTATTAGYETLLRAASRDLKADRLKWSDWVKLSKAKAAAALRDEFEAVQALAAQYASHPALQDGIRCWTQQIFALAADILSSYAEAKRARRVIDFVDQERLLLEALERPEVAEALGQEIDLLMVDEFQDTSPLQLALFARLAGLAKRTVWVGDLKQAIYGFRGSDVALMQSVLKALPALGATQSVLPRSYRSRPELVALVNEVFTPAFSSTLTEEQVKLEPARAAQLKNEAFEWWHLEGSNVETYTDSLARGVADLLARAPNVVDKATNKPRPMHCGDLAILARTNVSVKMIADALSALGVPVAVAQSGLLATPEASLAWACLRRLNDPADTLASAEIISLTECPPGDALLAQRLTALKADPENAHRWREAGDDANPVLAALAAMRRQARYERSPAETLAQIITTCDLPRYVQQWRPDAERGERRLANLASLQTIANDYETSCHSRRIAPTLPGLLLHLDALVASEEDTQSEHGGNAVRVLTHHAAKGLEWAAVICTDLHHEVRSSPWGLSVQNDQATCFENPLAGRSLRYWIWPFGDQRSGIAVADQIEQACGGPFAEAAAEEAKRLLYVSMTRARDLLIFAVPTKHKVRPWLETLQANWLMPRDDGTLGLPLAADGSAIRSAVRIFDREKDATPFARPTSTPPIWFAQHPPATEALPAFVSPSSQTTGADHATLQLTVQPYGQAIQVLGSPDMATLGEALHATIAHLCVSQAAWREPDAVRALLERWNVAHALNASAVITGIASLQQAITERWAPDALMVEVPVESLLPNGQVMRGRIDMLLRNKSGWILIDHKSNRVRSGNWPEEATEYAGQLAAYAEAIERATGAPVIARVINFFTAQVLVIDGTAH